MTGGPIGARCGPVLNYTNTNRSGVPVEAVRRYLLQTPDPVEMVPLNPGWGVRQPPQAREIPGLLPPRQ